MMYGEHTQEFNEWASRFIRSGEEATLNLKTLMEAVEKLSTIHPQIPELRVVPVNFIEKDTSYVVRNTIYISDCDMYKWIFLNGDLSDEALKFAGNYAERKIHILIDNIAKRYSS